MYIQDEVIEQIKDRLDLVDIVGEYVHLIKRGQNHVGLCPFHMEKTPSFNVNINTNTYKCFGCGASGDVIEFIKNMEGLDFISSVKYLADKAHIDIKFDEEKSISYKKDKTSFYDINRDAAIFFRDNLIKSKEVKEYLKKRDINSYSINTFGLGYAENKWDSLLNHLKTKYKETELFEAGLILYNEKNNNYYDAFRNRLIFPIIDIRNRVVGFGGRIIGEGEPKYYNSKESDVFVKGNNLYGLHVIKENRNREKIVLVEGNIDVVMLHQYGIDFAVAGLGTALTKRQAQLLKRFGNDVYLCLDGDTAGQKATLRDTEILREEGVSPKIIVIPDNMDPDDYIKKNKKEGFMSLINNAIDSFDFALKYFENGLNLENRSDFINFIRKVQGYIKNVPSDIEKEIYIKDVSKRYGIDESVLKKEIIVERKEDSIVYENFTIPKGIHKLEKKMMDLCVTDKVNFSEFYDLKTDDYLSKLGYKELYNRIKDEYEEKEYIDLEKFKEELLTEGKIPKNFINRLEKGEYSADTTSDAIKDIHEGIRINFIKDKRRKLKEEFQNAMDSGDNEKMIEIMKEMDQLE